MTGVYMVMSMLMRRKGMIFYENRCVYFEFNVQNSDFLMLKIQKLWCIHSDKGLMLEMSAFLIFHGGNSTLSTHLVKPKFLIQITQAAQNNAVVHLNVIALNSQLLSKNIEIISLCILVVIKFLRGGGKTSPIFVFMTK